MSAAEMAIDSVGNEGAASVESGAEVGGSPSANPETTSTEASPSRPDYLLEGYENETAQAQAFHKFHQQYGGYHDHYAQQGSWFSQRYHTDPVFKQWVDDYNQGKVQQQQAAPQKQEQDPFDIQDPAKLNEAWEGWINQPTKFRDAIKQSIAAELKAEFQKELAPVRQAQNAERAQRLFSTHKTTLQEMQGNPYGQKLLALTNRGMDPEEAIATYLAAKQQFAAQAATPAPQQAQQPVRDNAGRFQRTAGNGRRAGTTQTGKALTPAEIVAEAKAGRLR